MIGLFLSAALLVGQPDPRLEHALSEWTQCRWEQFVEARRVGLGVESAAETATMLCRDWEHAAEVAYDRATRDAFFAALAVERVKKTFREVARKIGR